MCAGMAMVAVATRMTFATGLCLSVHGCENVEGGAVELSWKLRPASSSFEDKFVDCDPGQPGTNPVTHIRLDWEVGDKQDFATWECDDNHGTTGFDLPEGNALLRVTPECAGTQAVAASYIAPAAEQRRVIVGDTISLGAVEIIVVVTDCGDQSGDQPCICHLPFAFGHTPWHRGGAAIASGSDVKQPAAAPSNARH